jgi:hypothetical protein
MNVEDRAVLLRLALGDHTVRTEHRFRHRETGETSEMLDLRTMDFADWDGESRTVIETDWRERP